MKPRAALIIGVCAASALILCAIAVAKNSRTADMTAEIADASLSGEQRGDGIQSSQAPSLQLTLQHAPSGKLQAQHEAAAASAAHPLQLRDFGAPDPSHIENPALRKFLDPTAHDRIPDDIDVAIPNLRTKTEFNGVRRAILDPGNPDEVRNEAITLLRRSSDPELELILLHISDTAKESGRMRAFAVQHLGISYGEGVRRVEQALQRMCGSGPMEIRREAVWALVDGGYQNALVVVDACWGNREWVAHRDILISSYQSLGAHDRILEIRKSLKESNGSIVIAAIVTLAQWNDLESVPEINQISREHQDPRVRRTAHASLKKFTGTSGN